jgi:hypothetical protein
MERLNKLIALFEGTDNVYVLSELKLAKIEIEIDLLKIQISEQNKSIKILKDQICSEIEKI